MATAAQTAPMSAAEYLAWEREQLERHEFVDGAVYAMAGGSPRHNRLASRALVVLELAVQHRGCAALNSDQRISLAEGTRYYYPDLSVVCGPLELDTGGLRNPSVLVEVISTSTEALDRGAKWNDYQRLASLQDYLLISQRTVLVEHFQRSEGAWLYTAHGAGTRVTLADRVEFEVDAIYDGVMRFPSDE